MGREVNPVDPPSGHSAIEALQAARALVDAGSVEMSALVINLPMSDYVKLMVVDPFTGEHVLDTECSKRDASFILAALGMGPSEGANGVANKFTAEGMDVMDAISASALLRKQGSG